jgi:hypothetical protein
MKGYSNYQLLDRHRATLHHGGVYHCLCVCPSVVTAERPSVRLQRNQLLYFGSDALMAVINFLWVVKHRSSEAARRFGATYCIHLQGRRKTEVHISAILYCFLALLTLRP